MDDEFDNLVHRIEGEYIEMPGLQLTYEQAQRLWALDHTTCALVLKELVDRRFLVRGIDARYRRATDGTLMSGHLRPARAAMLPSHRRNIA